MSTRWTCPKPRRRTLAAVGVAAAVAVGVVAAFALSTASAPRASADVSHVGWPHTVTVAFASNAGGTMIGTDGGDLLLGGPGSDTIYGGPGNDIIWGDQHPVPNNPTTQVDNLYGGAGDNWIYASHGLNHIFSGPDNNHIFAYFGRGTIDCGAGNDIVTLDKSDRHAYTETNCKDVVIGYP